MAVEKLRLQGCECGGVSVFISTCNYHSEGPDGRYSDRAYARLPRMTSYPPDIVAAARSALRSVFRPGYGYRTVMVTLADILPAAFQGELWTDPGEDVRKRKLMEGIDRTCRTYGRGTVTLAKGFERIGWEMRRNFLSPCWTTRYPDFPKVH